MTYKNLILATAVATLLVSACKSTSRNAPRQNVDNLGFYVDSLKNVSNTNDSIYWAYPDENYQQRLTIAEKSVAELEAQDVAKLDSIKNQYSKMKAAYEAKLKTQATTSTATLNVAKAQLEAEKQKNEVTTTTPTATSNYKLILRNRLFGEGKIGADMKFETVNEKNILGIYKNFVNTVADNKKDYTREDWDEVKVLYEALDNRKNSIEKNLSTKDNMEIAGLKIRFSSIKSTRRVTAKADENTDSKN